MVVVPEDAFHDLENPGPGRLYLLTVLSGDADFAEVLRHGIPTPSTPRIWRCCAASDRPLLPPPRDRRRQRQPFLA